MNERFDAHLDGDLTADELDERGRAQVAAFQAGISQLRKALDSMAPVDLDRAVMRRIEELGLEPIAPRAPGPLKRRLGALVAVRETHVRWRPIYGLAAAAMIAALVLVPALGREAAVPLADATAPTVYVQFRLLASEASDVSLVGSFSGWQPDAPMRRAADGVWTVVVPLPPGVHDYAFIVDGQRWMPDPYAPTVDDGFGGTHSRLMLLAPQAI